MSFPQGGSKVLVTSVVSARDGGRALQRLSADDRADIINKLADLLIDNQSEIFAANKKDLDAARMSGRQPDRLTHESVVSTSTWHTAVWGSIPCSDQAWYIRCKNLSLNIIDCVSLCLSGDTLKAVGPFYLVSMLGEVKYTRKGVNV